MATDAGWGRRLRAARRAYEERHDCSLSYREIGERVGAILARAAFAHPTVRAWFMDGQEPDSFAVARALAAVLETDAGQLITGGDAAPAPAVPAMVPTPAIGETGAAFLARTAKEKAASKGGRKRADGGKGA